MKNQNEVTLVAVPQEECGGCVFDHYTTCGARLASDNFPCDKSDRVDGVSVIWVVKESER